MTLIATIKTTARLYLNDSQLTVIRFGKKQDRVLKPFRQYQKYFGSFSNPCNVNFWAELNIVRTRVHRAVYNLYHIILFSKGQNFSWPRGVSWCGKPFSNFNLEKLSWRFSRLLTTPSNYVDVSKDFNYSLTLQWIN